VNGLASIVRDFPASVRLIVWLNEYFGPIVNTSGKPFEELPAYMAPENSYILCVQKSGGSASRGRHCESKVSWMRRWPTR
jgi:hypothetical protein